MSLLERWRLANPKLRQGLGPQPRRVASGEGQPSPQPPAYGSLLRSCGRGAAMRALSAAFLAALHVCSADTAFERASQLIAAAQQRCDAVEVLSTRSRQGGFAAGVHSVVAALSSSLLSGRALAVARGVH